MTPYTAPDYDLELKQINSALQKLDKGIDAASLYFQSNRGLYLGIRNPSEKDAKVFYHALSGHPDIIMEKLKGILWILNVLTGGVC